MSMSFTMEEAAAQFGLQYPFDESVLGAVVSGYWRGDIRIGYPRTFVLDTANGFEWQITVTTYDDTNGRVQAMTMAHGTTELWQASGDVVTTYPSFNLSDIFRGDDTFTGNSSNNLFYADAGNDTIDGGAGIDHVYYNVARSAVNIAVLPDHVEVAYPGVNPTDTDTLRNVERIDFTDESVAYDTNGPAGQAYRLYQAALDRAPDPGGLGYYIDKLEHGWSEHDIAIGFIFSPEFQTRFGSNLTDLQFIGQLYENVLHREGEAAGVAYHLNALQTGQVDREQLLVNFSESPENQANVISAIQQGMVYWPVTH